MLLTFEIPWSHLFTHRFEVVSVALGFPKPFKVSEILLSYVGMHKSYVLEPSNIKNILAKITK